MNTLIRCCVLTAVALLFLSNKATAQLLPVEQKLRDLTKTLPHSTIPSKEWDRVNSQVSKTVASIKDPLILLDLALWCHYAAPTEQQMGERSFVFAAARDACIYRISTIHTDVAKIAIRKFKRSVLLDGGLGLVVGNALKDLKVNEDLQADFTFEIPKKLDMESIPLSKGDIQTRSMIIDSFWSVWEKEGTKNWPDGETVECKLELTPKESKLLSLTLSGKGTLKPDEKEHLSNSIRHAISIWKLPSGCHKLGKVVLYISFRRYARSEEI